MTRDEEAARAYLARLVALRPRTVGEARTRLLGKGFSAEVVERAVSWAQDAGILDDRLFARLYAEDRLLSRPCSRSLLARELREKGVGAALAEEVAQAALPELSEGALARRALEPRLPLWRGLPPDVAARRAAAFLLRRGFSPAVARAVVEDALGTLWTSE
ncbi:MAG: RecX family transcriptional regulator [Candidatus Bipolaricaulota bacterium]|nr:RecX family transcriptional regulator [Candidatus Bipolaricaulota bacterium]